MPNPAPAPTQYDSILSSYTALYGSEASTFPGAVLEESNMKHVITPFLRTGPRVLDLACGSGFFSRRYLEWGTSSVVGVDISAAMVGEARRVQQEAESEPEMKTGEVGTEVDEKRGKMTYLVGDAKDSVGLKKLLEENGQGPPFDVVTGTWLLNYASSRADMTAMWRSISDSLTAGGVFVGMTIPPPLGDATELGRSLNQEWKKYGCSGHVLRTVYEEGKEGDDNVDIGFEVHTVLGMPNEAGDVVGGAEFDTFYLRNNVFEDSARQGGMEGGLEWRPFVLVEDLTRAQEYGYWNDAVLNPEFRIGVARKKSR